MITVQNLRDFGADVDDGLSRCMNNEAFYLRLVGMALSDGNFDKLKTGFQRQKPGAASSCRRGITCFRGKLF